MSNSPDGGKKAPVLIQGTSGGPNFANFFLMLLGLLGIVLQVMVFVSESANAAFGEVKWLPGTIGGVLLLSFILSILMRGKITLYPHRLEVKKAIGGSLSVDFAEGMEIDPHISSVIIRGKDNKPVFVQTKPRPSKIKGLVWMMLKYPWLREQGWLYAIPELGRETPENFIIGLKRDFQIPDEPVFHDAGFIAEHEGTGYFFPFSDTYVMPDDLKAYNSVSRSLRQQEFVLHFDPNPAVLPLPDVIRSLFQAGQPATELAEKLEALCSEHGGTLLADFDPKADNWVGEVRDIPVSIGRFQRRT